MEQVSFRSMEDGTAEDYALLHKYEARFVASLPDRIMTALERLDESLAGYQVTRLEHSLQCATRAEADGADIEMIIAALVHDLGDELSPENHSQLAAAIIKPYVRAEVTWIIEMHGVFQLKYYGDKIGLNPDERERWRGHKWFDSCETFCRDWDQMSFDPDYPTKPLAYFQPMISEIFSRPPFDLDSIEATKP